MLLGNDLYTVVDCGNECLVIAVYSTVSQCRAFCDGLLLSQNNRSLAIKSVDKDKVILTFNFN
jgi:hypothetical protein